MLKKNILIIGLGPHCKRVYINGLKRLKLCPLLIVDLESKRKEVEEFKKEHNLSSALFFIPDIEKDFHTLSKKVEQHLDGMIKILNITHAIISTEPKAHYAYLKYLITRRIHTLADKPITSPANVINDAEQAHKIRSEYQELLALAKNYNTRVVVQCQRRYDARYQWIIKQIKSITQEFDIPVSHIQLTHCDGSWNMPDEYFTRENHPYKYGYGKLFHSGYHFLDLLNILLSYDTVSEHKRPDSCMASSIHYSPDDQLYSLDANFYSKVFNHKDYSPSFEKWSRGAYQTMGELDIIASFEFSKNSHILTTCSLNLLQSGFSRRAWANLPVDTYKGNGRVRHESVNIQIGPLANIQVHSYQAHEIKERNNLALDHSSTGGLEHFDIHIYRNSDLIGGSSYEKIIGKNLFEAQIENSNNFIGYNEHARTACLSDFLYGTGNISPFQDQELTIDLATHAHLSMCQRRSGRPPISKFSITNDTPKERNYDKTKFNSSLSSRQLCEK